MQKVEISVIIPIYNEGHVIEGCISSLLKQNTEHFEIIIVDDGSTDNPKLQTQSKSIVFLKQRHQGAGAARNLGAKHAKGSILVFVDADMVFESNFLERLVEPIVDGKAIGTFSKDEYVGNWENVWARCWNYNLNLGNKKRLPDNYPDKQKVFRAISTSEFKKVNGFTPGGYTDDWSISEKLGELATSAPGAKFYHKNPETLKEVFMQAKWVAKRKYKLGLLGFLVALLRVSFISSIILGVTKSIIYREYKFILFKIVYDFGTTIGIFSYYATKKGAK